MLALRLFAVALLLLLTTPGEGLTPLRASYQRHILEFHNTVRGEVARGNITHRNTTITVPKASGLRVFEWWARLDKEAARIAREECEGEGVTAFKSTDVNVFVATKRTVAAPLNATVADLLYAMTDLSDNATFADQPLVDEGMVRLGCAIHRCKARQLMVCVYASDRLKPRDPSLPPYRQGPPCSACPTGNSFCVNNVLCATHWQCGHTMSRCDCLISHSRCLKDGGQFDDTTCECMCGEKKSAGLYCHTPCTDHRCGLTSRQDRKEDGERTADRSRRCFETGTQSRLLVVATCRRTCNFCRADALDSLKRTGRTIPINIYSHRFYLDRRRVHRRIDQLTEMGD